MRPETTIPSGYILLARKMLESELMNKPPHYLKLWIWMLCKAFWKDGEILKRGQFQTSISEMQDIGRHKIGNQFVGRLTVDQVRAAYNWFKTSDMISIAKPTDKMTITIINFDSYQDSTLYKSHKKADTEAQTAANTTRNIMQPADNVIKSNQSIDGISHGKTRSKPHTIEKKVLKEVKTLCASPTSKRPPSGDHQTFLAWWSYAYERTQGKPYLTTGKDFRPVKELLAAYGLKPLVITSCWFLTCQDDWLASKRDITMLKSQINRLPGPKDERHTAQAYRTAGIIPPEGTMFEDWHFWQQEELQEAGTP